MGTDAFNDINAFDEKKDEANGKKVVIVYTTAGNLHDDDDTKSCDCKDANDPKRDHIPYWQVRETGAKSSIHLAACRTGGWGPNLPRPANTSVKINGHSITRYEFKNTVSYFLRIKSGIYGNWYDRADVAVGTVDSSTIYDDRTDFVNTLYAIYKEELGKDVATDSAVFHFPDTDEQINPGDHHDHLIAGRAGLEAAQKLAKKKRDCFPVALYIDYHTQHLPENIASPDVQNEAAITGVYCLALLDYNAWPEWGGVYHLWTNRNYYRMINTCDNKK